MSETMKYVRTLIEIDRRLASIYETLDQDEIYDLRAEIWNIIDSYTGRPVIGYETKEVLRG